MYLTIENSDFNKEKKNEQLQQALEFSKTKQIFHK